jgi:hypothetical protein
MVNKISQLYRHIVHVTDIISLIDNEWNKQKRSLFYDIISMVWVGFRLPEENSKELFETCG